MLEECGAFLPARLQTSSCASFKHFPFPHSLLLRGSGARWCLSSLLPSDDSELVAFGLCTRGLWFVISCCEVVRGALVWRRRDAGDSSELMNCQIARDDTQ